MGANGFANGGRSFRRAGWILSEVRGKETTSVITTGTTGNELISHETEDRGNDLRRYYEQIKFISRKCKLFDINDC